MATGATPREIGEMIDRGAECYSDGDVRKAAELWRQALDLAPDDLRARAYLAWAEARLAADGGGSVDEIDIVETEPVTVARASLDDEELTRGRNSFDDSDGDSLLTSALADFDPTRLRGPTHRSDSHGGDDEPTDLFMVGGGDPQGWSVPPAVHTDPTRISTDLNPSALVDNLFEEFDDAPPPRAPVPRQAILTEDEEMVIEMTAGEPDENFDPRPTPPRPQAKAPSRGKTPPPRTKTPPPPRGLTPPPRRPATPVRDQLTPVYEEVSHRWRIGPREDPLAAARVALERGDLEAAFVVAEKVVAKVSGIDSPELIKHQDLLLGIYERQLGDLGRPLAVAAPPSDLHPRAAFLLSRVDGEMSIDDLRDVSGMPRLEATRLIAVLLRRGAIVAISR